MTPAARIGLFMLAGMIILGVFIIKIEDIPVGERGERLEVTARFPSVAGLDRKAAVRIAGVRVGKVEAVNLDGSEALLHLSLNPQVQLHEGAWAQITSLGMLGDKYIEILPGDPTAPLLPAGAELGGTTMPSFDDVMRVATEIGADVKEVTEALRGSIGGPQGEEALEEIVANIRDLTASLKVLITENQANVNQTTENFKDFSATLRDEMPKITNKLNTLADQLNGVVGENRDDLQASMGNIRELTDRTSTRSPARSPPARARSASWSTTKPPSTTSMKPSTPSKMESELSTKQWVAIAATSSRSHSAARRWHQPTKVAWPSASISGPPRIASSASKGWTCRTAASARTHST
jgi:phospholipid/cholesterol/gamma-HCH transport system substrate-binding protein